MSAIDVIEKINTILWIGFVIFSIITFLVKRAQIKSWNEGVDKKVVGGMSYRPIKVREHNVFLEGALYVLFCIDIALFSLGVITIPNY